MSKYLYATFTIVASIFGLALLPLRTYPDTVRLGIGLCRISLGVGRLTFVFMTPRAVPLTGQRFVSVQYDLYCPICSAGCDYTVKYTRTLTDTAAHSLDCGRLSMCRSEEELDIVKDEAAAVAVKGVRVLRDQLYPVKINNVRTDTVL